MDADSLTLNIVKPVAAMPDGPALFAIVKDENYFLPFFFDYYRALGVEVFVIYDDRSGPATVDFLMRQADCVILRSDCAFGDVFGVDEFGVPRRLPVVLKDRAPESFLPGRWVLTVDADEFLVLPSGCGSLPEFIAALERAGQLYATAPMVDFYGETLEQRNYPRELNPFEGSPYFDVGPYYYWTGDQLPFRLNGTVRLRLLKRLCEEFPERVVEVFRTPMPPLGKCWKVPLLKHGYGVVRKADHEINVAPRATDLSVALAHFKFYPDLDAKIENALAQKQYFGGSVEYSFLKTAIELYGRDSLVGPETTALRRARLPGAGPTAGASPPARGQTRRGAGPLIGARRSSPYGGGFRCAFPVEARGFEQPALAVRGLFPSGRRCGRRR